jgi:hypothetical protein
VEDIKSYLSCELTNPAFNSLAYFEMRLLLAHVLWNFDLELMPQSESWANQKVFAIWDKPELYVKLKPRAGLEVRA